MIRDAPNTVKPTMYDAAYPAGADRQALLTSSTRAAIESPTPIPCVTALAISSPVEYRFIRI